MNILLYTGKEYDEWRAALLACLPAADVFSWPDAPACDYAVLWRPPAALLAQHCELKAIFSLGAGVDALLATGAVPAQVPLIRMEDVGMAEQMIEYALYAALHQYRAVDHYAQAQQQQKWAPQALRQRRDFHVGVLGLGVLGAQVASALAAFGFSVQAWSRTPRQLAEVDCHYGEGGLHAVLAQSELLIVLLPLTAATEGLLDRERMQRLPPGAALVNLSRGALLVEDDLLALLDSGHIAQAFLDVFSTEPLPASHRFWTHPRVHITPHVAALTPYRQAAQQVAEKIAALQRGEPISGIVDRVQGY